MAAEPTTQPAAASGTVSLGDLTVNRMGFGAMRLTGSGVWGDPPDREGAKAVLRYLGRYTHRVAIANRRLLALALSNQAQLHMLAFRAGDCVAVLVRVVVVGVVGVVGAVVGWIVSTVVGSWDVSPTSVSVPALWASRVHQIAAPPAATATTTTIQVKGGEFFFKLSTKSIAKPGTVTFVFSDVEGSTELLKRLGDHYSQLISDHRSIVRETFGAHGGIEIDAQGDAFFFAFSRARDAAAAACRQRRRPTPHRVSSWGSMPGLRY
jgi:hypothetical protein